MTSSGGKMQPRLVELLAFLNDERENLLTTASALPGARWGERSVPDRWSVSEILWHLQRTETNIAGLIAKRTTKARAEHHPQETETSSVLGRVEMAKVTDRSKRLTSPSSIAPDEVPDEATVRGLLETSRAAMRNALTGADGLALGTIMHTHPAFGELDLYQWILFVGLHERRHGDQIGEVVAELQ
jgi:hypothetical protein